MVAEFELIDAIRRRFPAPEGVAVGIGDDAAVLSEHFELATTDILVEGVHFRLDWCDPADVGWKAVTASLSDIAAMGGRPGPYLVSVALGPDRGEGIARGLVDGFTERADGLEGDLEVVPVGGDLSGSSGPLVVSVAMFGECSGPQALTRDGAEEGDEIVLIGRPGRSAAGLDHLRGSKPGASGEFDELADAYRRPDAQVEPGMICGRAGLVRSMIDVSDGLARDLGHICEESDVGARVDLSAVPREQELEQFAKSRGESVEPYLTGGGEDFCLVGTVPPDGRERFERRADSEGWPYAWIGAIVSATSGVEFFGADGEPIDLSETGYQHVFDT